jgi:branched-chain amino acid transport system permease protein
LRNLEHFIKRDKVKIAGYLPLLIIVALVPTFAGKYIVQLGVLILMYIVITSSLRTVYISGQISLGHAAFMGIGAYFSGVLAVKLGWSPWGTIWIGGLAATVVGIIIGFAFSRLRSIYFTMGSLFLGILISSVVAALTPLTGGYSGLSGIPRLFDLAVQPYYYFFLALAVLTLLFLYRVEHSRIGMNFKMVAQSEKAASSIGINDGNMRIFSLGLGCFFAGLAGAGYAHYVTYITPFNFALMPSFYLLIYLLVGGSGNLVGPIVGAFVLYLISTVFNVLMGYSPFLLAGVLVLVIFLLPQGLISLPQRIQTWISRLRERRMYERPIKD